jgi:hypothetical protein
MTGQVYSWNECKSSELPFRLDSCGGGIPVAAAAGVGRVSEGAASKYGGGSRPAT